MLVYFNFRSIYSLVFFNSLNVDIKLQIIKSVAVFQPSADLSYNNNDFLQFKS